MRLSHLYKRVCPSISQSVCWSVILLVGWFVHDAFVKTLKSIEKSLFFCISMQVYCKSIHSLVFPPIIFLSVCPLFCPSVYPSIYPYVCNHIVEIAKSVAISNKINGEIKRTIQWTRLTSKEKYIEKPHRCSYELVFQ